MNAISKTAEPGLLRRTVARIAAASIERRFAAVLMALGSACAVATIFALFHYKSS